MNASASFYVKPSENELIETTVHMKPDPHPALLGTVVSEDGKPLSGALVAIYRSGGAGAPDSPEGSLYTDEFGQFAFGPLDPGKLYLVRVYKNNRQIRTLEQPEN